MLLLLDERSSNNKYTNTNKGKMKGKKIKTLLDIEDEERERNKQKFKKQVSGDVRDIFDDIFKPKPTPKKKTPPIWKLIKWLGILFLLMFLLILVLGSVWLLRELIKSLFMGG